MSNGLAVVFVMWDVEDMGMLLSLLLPILVLEGIEDEDSIESPIGRNSDEDL